MLSNKDFVKEQEVYIYKNLFINEKTKEHENNLNTELERYQKDDLITIVNVLILKEMIFEKDKAVAVTAIKNYITDEEYETTKDVEDELNILKKQYETKEKLKEYITGAVDTLCNMRIEEFERPANLFPLPEIYVILPKNNEYETTEIMSFFSKELNDTFIIME